MFDVVVVRVNSFVRHSLFHYNVTTTTTRRDCVKYFTRIVQICDKRHNIVKTITYKYDKICRIYPTKTAAVAREGLAVDMANLTLMVD